MTPSEADDTIDTFDELVRQCDELHTENAKLRTMVANLRMELDELRAKNERFTQIDDERCKIVDELRAELERTRSNHVTVAEEVQRRHDACAPLTAEIEQLRAAIEAYLENDSQANWDALAALVGDQDG